MLWKLIKFRINLKLEVTICVDILGIAYKEKIGAKDTCLA